MKEETREIERLLNDRVEDEEREQGVLSDALDLMGSAIKVHTEEIDLNEDATLSNLNIQFPKLSKYAIEQIELISIIGSYLNTNKDVIRVSNCTTDGTWNEKLIYKNPDNRVFKECKRLLMNRIHSMLILSRSAKGGPLKSFLTYGRDVSNKEMGVEEKQGILPRLKGKKKEDEDDGI